MNARFRANNAFVDFARRNEPSPRFNLTFLIVHRPLLPHCLYAGPPIGPSSRNVARVHYESHDHRRRDCASIPRDSRYFATVRRFTSMPFSFSAAHIFASLNGWPLSSAAIRSLIICLISNDETAPVVACAPRPMPEETRGMARVKNIFSGNVPHGVWIYFPCTARLTVDT